MSPFDCRNPKLKTFGDWEIKCTDNLKYLKKIASNSVGLIVTSPPYNVGKRYDRHHDGMSFDEYLDWQGKVLSECNRVLKDGGSLCWQVGTFVEKPTSSASGKRRRFRPLDYYFFDLIQETCPDLIFRNRIVWHFRHGLNETTRFSGRHEVILWFTKGDDYVFDLDAVRVPSRYPKKKHFKGEKKGEVSSNPKGMNPGDVWDIPNVKSNHVEKTEHPCQFPVGMIERLVLSLTREGDTVLDPFVGTGSAVIAAVKNERRGIGCDISRSYTKIARDRLRQLQNGKLRLRPMNQETYVPPKRTV
jgi:adenine-specific DNA-methyltransferase